MKIGVGRFLRLFLLCLGCLIGSFTHGKPSINALTVDQQTGIAALTQGLQKELKKENCSDSSCQVLVMDFTLRSGGTCATCMLLSDALAKTLRELPGAPTTVSRDLLASFLDEERLPPSYLTQERPLSWIAEQLHAKRVVFGTLDFQGDSLSLSAKVLKYERLGENIHTSKELRVKLPVGDLTGGLTASHSYSPLQDRESLPDGTEAHRMPEGTSRSVMPSCFYSPSPSYTDPARSAKISGIVLLQVVITVEGNLIHPRIIRGLPYGLNKNSLETLKTWKCSPATVNGKPVSVLVPIEVTFRLY